jgi:hypothetical protein
VDRAAILLLFSFITRANAGALLSPPPLGTLVDVGGYRVHLYCTGTGRPTVVVVGGGFSFDWALNSAVDRQLHAGVHVRPIRHSME